MNKCVLNFCSEPNIVAFSSTRFIRFAMRRLILCRSFCFQRKFKLIFVGGNFSIYYQTKWFYCYDYGYTMISVTLFPLFSFYCYCCLFWLLLSASSSTSSLELIRVIRCVLTECCFSSVYVLTNSNNSNNSKYQSANATDPQIYMPFYNKCIRWNCML